MASQTKISQKRTVYGQKGGDMYEQQKSFRELIAGLTNEKVKDSVSKISCEVIELDGTISIQRNVEIIKKWIQL